MSAGDDDEEVGRHGRKGARAHGLGALRRAQKIERRFGVRSVTSRMSASSQWPHLGSK